MSNNYLDISKRTLLLNKKRSMLLIVGIMLSVALMTAMATFFYSMKEYQMKSAREEGDYHVAYKDISLESMDIIKNYASVDEYAFYESLGVFPIGKVKNTFIKSDKKALEMQGYSIEGELPKNKNEIAVAVSGEIKYGKDIVIGETIKVNLNGKNEELTITGILKGTTYKPTQIAVVNNNMTGTINSTVKLTEDKNLRENLDNLNLKISPGYTTKDVDGGIEENNSLLATLGASKYTNMNDSIEILVIVLFSIVIASTVIMIFNAFNITIMERIKEYGLLKAVGSTPSQIRSMVFFEAGIIGAIAIPLGIAVGYFGLEIFFGLFAGMFMERIKDVEILFSARVMAISILLGIVTVFLSALFPTLKAGRISPLECINDSTIKIKKVPKGRITNKLLKIEGLLAFRNRKINKKRYYITVMAMTVSIAMFISIAATLSNSLNDFSNYRSIENNGEIEVSALDETNEFHYDYGASIKEKYSIIEEATFVYQPFYVEAFIKPEMTEGINNTHLASQKKFTRNNKTYRSTNMNVRVIDKTSEVYLKEIISDFSYDKLVKDKSVVMVDAYKQFNHLSESYETEKTINAKVGDEFLLTKYDSSYFREDNQEEREKALKEASSMKIGYTTTSSESNGVPRVYIPIENMPFTQCYDKVNTEDGKNYELKKWKVDKVALISINIKDDADEEALESLRNTVDKDFSNIGYVNDKYAMEEERRAEILTIKMFVYGFIGIVSLISALNIINTVSTNIILRKKELSSLRAIGTSYEAVRKMLLMEGMMYGVTSSILGIIIGVALNYYLINVTSRVLETTYTLPIIEILIAFLGAILLGVVSIIVPLKKIKNISIIDGIRTLD